MKKIYLMAIIVFSFSAIVKAGDMEGLKGIDFANLDFEKMAEMEVSPVLEAVPAKLIKEKTDKELVGQDIVYKFKRVAKDLRKLRGETVWLKNDIDKLESDARRIASSNRPDPFFGRRLEGLATSTNRYANNAQKISADIRNLLSIAVKSDDLNKIAKSMEWDARDLYNESQFQLDNAARKLELASRSIKPSSIWDNAPHWIALDIASNVRSSLSGN